MVVETLTVRQTAEAMQSTIGHIYRLIAQGYLAAINISPGSKRSSLRVTRNALVTFLENDQTKKDAKTTKRLRPAVVAAPVNGIRKLRKRNSIRNGVPSFLPPDTETNPVSTFFDIKSGM